MVGSIYFVFGNNANDRSSLAGLRGGAAGGRIRARGASRLALTQSAVSQRVKLLEAELGQVLLVRSKAGAATPAGRRAAALPAQLLHLMEAGGAMRCRRAGSGHCVSQRTSADLLATWFIARSPRWSVTEGIVSICVVDDQGPHPRAARRRRGAGLRSTRADPMRAALPYASGHAPIRQPCRSPRALSSAGSHPATAARCPAISLRPPRRHARGPLLRGNWLDSRRIHTTSPRPRASRMAFAPAGLGHGFVPRDPGTCAP